MVSSMKVVLFAVPILIAGSFVTVSRAQGPQTPTKAVQLTGLVGVKNNTKGSLTVENGALRFTQTRGTSELAPGSIQDVVTGDGTTPITCSSQTGRRVLGRSRHEKDALNQHTLGAPFRTSCTSDR